MADKKISALPPATTPLAGTEVLPIVQSSTTDRVSVANLTAGRAVSVGSLDSAGDAVVGTGNAGLTQFGLTTTGEAADQKLWRFQTGTGIGAGTLRLRTINDAISSGQNVWVVTRTGENVDSHSFLTGGANRLVIGATDVTFSTGNLIQGTAAKGINFTANTPAAGKTSQLLNWYEEGTATLGIAFGGGTTGITYGGRPIGYVRVGSLVTVTGYIALSNKGSSTGAATITGLPFTTASSANGGYAAVSLSASNLTFVGQYSGYTAASGTTVNLYQTSALGVLSTLTDTNFANNTEIEFCITYRCA